jgi:signal transduction histidine kinase
LTDGGDGVIVVLRDVTERRKVEAMRRDFVADASHELKTPVASIQAAAETLVRAIGEDPVAARRFASQVHATSVRLSQMVTDLLDLSRMESERPDLHEVDLARLVRKEVDRIADRAEVQGVDLVLDVEEVVIQASRKDVRLAVRNLLENALAYTPEGGMVTVGTRREGAVAVLSVTDTGIGIPGRDTARIFERFYRVDDARHRDTGGTGLGLAIVRHVAEQHGGSVEVESELGRGSTFLIRLPLSPL